MRSVYQTISTVFAVVFGALCLVSLYGVVFHGAWWHLIGAAIEAVMATAMFADARKEKEESENGEVYDPVDDHHPYPEE